MRRYLSLGAAAGVLASSAAVAAPGWAATQVPPGEAAGFEAAEPEAAPGNSSLSDTSLAEAVQRDLGLTPEQFASAGKLGTRAAAAAEQLRSVPGYTGTRLQDGQVVVSGSGPELLHAAAALPGVVIEAPSAPAGEPGSAHPGSELALSTEQLFRAYIAEVGPQGLQAVVTTGGKFVIRTGGINSPESTSDAPDAGSEVVGAEVVAAGKISPAEFVSRFANVALDDGAPLAPEADVPGGVGYIADTGWICSTGFSAFDPAGLPAVLTAGHCASDGAAETAELEFQLNRTGLLGSFGFSQFGGPGNSWIVDPNVPTGPGDMALADPGNVGTDIAVLESLRDGLDPVPAASTWGDASQPEPDVKIIGTADPVAGMPVCRSGRTSAWSCGTVDAVGIFVVPGPTYKEPAETTDPPDPDEPAEPLDLRAFNGFLSYGVQSSGGDSGGPYVSGNYAVGTHAAGDSLDEDGNVIQNFAVGATLKDSMAVLPGYQLELFLNKPVVSSPAPGETYEPGGVISGNLPAAPASAVAANSKVRITIQGQEVFEVPVDAEGNWSFTAPDSTETLRFTAETVNGFSASGAAGFEFASAGHAVADAGGTASGTSAETHSVPSPTVSAEADDNAAVVPGPVATPPAGPGNTGNHVQDRAGRGDLAYTGTTALPVAAPAAGAIVVGVLLLALVRRRRAGSAA